MKKIALAVTLAALAGLPACTTVNPQRRTMTDWNLSLIKERADPCGTMSPLSAPRASQCGTKGDRAGRNVIDWVLVKPIGIVMMPISWLTDTLILNPIDAYKSAELDTHERRFCKVEDNWSDAQAAEHAYGVVPIATPWIVSDALAAPEFAGRWLWNSIYPADPVDADKYAEYWREHNEQTGK